MARASELEAVAELLAEAAWTRADLRAALAAGERADGWLAGQLAWSLDCLGARLPDAKRALEQALAAALRQRAAGGGDDGGD